jgi:hypothetical protein
MEKTAVEYIDSVLINLIKNFNSKDYQVACNTLINFRNVIIEQAKEIEKQQIIDSYDEGQRNHYEYSKDSEVNYYDGENYYQETFKK